MKEGFKIGYLSFFSKKETYFSFHSDIPFLCFYYIQKRNDDRKKSTKNCLTYMFENYVLLIVSSKRKYEGNPTDIKILNVKCIFFLSFKK